MRTLLRLLLLLVIVLGAAWLGLWWYAQGRLETGITGWANQMSTNPNIKISYDSIQRGTSPLAATVTLTNLHFVMQPNGMAPITATLPSVTLRIAAANPTAMHLDLPPQINFDAAQGNASITFGNVDLVDHLDPKAAFDSKVYPFRSNDLVANNINVLGSSGSLLVLHIDNVTGHADLNPNAGAGESAFSGTDSFSGVALSPLLVRIASIPFGGKIDLFSASANISGPVPADWQNLLQQVRALAPSDIAGHRKLILPAVHDWATTGGAADGSITLAIGPSVFKTDAAVKFDADAQPSGTANATANHLDALTSAITSAYPSTQDRINLIEAQLSPYLSTTDADGQLLTVHATYGSGAVNINGQKVSDMPKLDWNALENPPPPPATAPGDGSGADDATPAAPAATGQ